MAARLEIGLVAALAAVVAWTVWRSLSWPLLHDAPIMHYVAWRISEGAVPYRDIFDMNFPGVYLFHLAVLKTLGAGDAAWRAVDLGILVLTAAAIAALAAPWGRVAAMGGALFFAANHLASGAWNTGQRDLLVCPALLVGALGVARWAEAGGRRPLLVAGVALGAGLTIKPHAVLFVGALAVFVLASARRRGVPALAPAAVLVGGAALAPVAVAAWVAALGALGAWHDIVFGYLVPLYSRLNNRGDWMWLRWKMWLAVLAALALTAARVAATRRFTARHAIVLLGLAYGLVHFVGQRKGWEYHLYPFAAFAAVLLFSELAPALARRPRFVAWSLTASLVATVWIVAADGARAVASARVDSGWAVQKERRVTALAEDLGALARAGDLVQVFDTTEGAVHALLRRRLAEPTRFIYDFHFFHHVEAPAIRALRAELVHGLGARPPALVVVMRDGWRVAGYERIEGGFPELHGLLATRYRLVREGDGYRIYAKRHDS